MSVPLASVPVPCRTLALTTASAEPFVSKYTQWHPQAGGPAAGDFWRGKIVLDATNDLQTYPPLQSGGEKLQSALPTSFVVKCFNSTGVENMRDPGRFHARALNVIAGDDLNSKRTAMQLSEDVGFDTVDLGGTGMQEIECNCISHKA
jgi:predicted dinucleotide-binding enzyme